MTDDDKFFERLRGDAASLRHRPDEATLARIRARIEARILPEPSLAELLAAWFRPVAAALTAVAIAAAIGLTMVDDATYDDTVEIVMAGEAYSVGR